MRSCLSETVDCDYSSFRGTPPSTITRDEYVDQRKVALLFLKTQRNLSNISIIASATQAEATCNYAILRFHPEFDGSRERYFHSYGQYRFRVVRSGEPWSPLLHPCEDGAVALEVDDAPRPRNRRMIRRRLVHR